MSNHAKDAAAARAEARLERERRARMRAETAAAAIAAPPQDIADQVHEIEHAAVDRLQAEVPMRWIALSAIHNTQQQQTRRSRREIEEGIAELADSIAAHGLLSYPVVRPLAGNEGLYQTIAGHRRIEALMRLVERGPNWVRSQASLRDTLREGGADWTVPVLVRMPDDLRALAQTIAENDHRNEVSAWSKAQAYGRYREMARELGLPVENASIASALNLNEFTIAPYLRVAERITVGVLEGAGLTSGNADETLSRLSIDVLRAIVQPVSEARRADRLRKAMATETTAERMIERSAGTTAPEMPAVARPTRSHHDRGSGYQVNIRVPIAELRPSQAARYVPRMARVLAELVTRAGDELATTDDSSEELEWAITTIQNRWCALKGGNQNS